MTQNASAYALRSYQNGQLKYFAGFQSGRRGAKPMRRWGHDERDAVQFVSSRDAYRLARGFAGAQQLTVVPVERRTITTYERNDKIEG